MVQTKKFLQNKNLDLGQGNSFHLITRKHLVQATF